MSGIYIKGTDMPKDGEMLCVNIYPDGKVCINLDLECNRIATAVPVPPHGDLVDRDMVLKKSWDMETFYDAVRFAPTIIPAESEV